MAFVAIDKTETRDYVSKKDPDKENPTVFKLGAIPYRKMNRILDRLTSYRIDAGMSKLDGPAEAKIDWNQMCVELCEFGVKGWENMTDKDGKQIDCKIDINEKTKETQVLDDSMQRINDLGLIRELGEELRKMHKFTEEDLKNLS